MIIKIFQLFILGIILSLFSQSTIVEHKALAADQFNPLEIDNRPFFNLPHQDIVSCDDPSVRTRCNDGICSNQRGAGICSAHGGVAEYIYPVIDNTTTEQVVSSDYIPPSEVEIYHAGFTAISEEVTIFISAVRRYPNPRYTRYLFDCVSLVPVESLHSYDLYNIADEDSVGGGNLVYNGNFEFGFEGIPWLGAEAVNWGENEEGSSDVRPSVVPLDSTVPTDWHWFMNEQTHGKYRMYDEPGLPLLCPDDTNQSDEGKHSLVIEMLSTDQPNARLGIYQKIQVTPGQNYLFSMQGLVQRDIHLITAERNHRVEIAFDPRGNTDWHLVPEPAWIYPRWREQPLSPFIIQRRYIVDGVQVFDFVVSNHSAVSVDVTYNDLNTTIPTKLIPIDSGEDIFEPIPPVEAVEEEIPTAYPPGYHQETH